MNKFLFTNVIFALLAVLSWSCSNNELEEIKDSEVTVNETVAFSRSAGNIDYSQFTLLENRYVMPRTGEAYNGTINYRGLNFGLNLYWDFDFEDFNMYGYIYGQVVDFAGDTHYMQHVATYKSASSNFQLCYIINCNYIINDSGFKREYHVSFYVAYTPSSQTLTCNVIEEGDGVWGDPDRV